MVSLVFCSGFLLAKKLVSIGKEPSLAGEIPMGVGVGNWMQIGVGVLSIQFLNFSFPNFTHYHYF